jgi:hypothetical protein
MSFLKALVNQAPGVIDAVAGGAIGGTASGAYQRVKKSREEERERFKNFEEDVELDNEGNPVVKKWKKPKREKY